MKCHYLNGLCYARYDSEPNLPLRVSAKCKLKKNCSSIFQYYIHSHFDVAHITSKTSHLLKESEEMEINYKMIETSASKNIKYLSMAQRKCRFEDEALSKEISVYSTSMCKMMCRYKMAMSFCGCKPFFYNFLCKYSLICNTSWIEKLVSIHIHSILNEWE